MRYIIKSGNIYEETQKEPLLQLKSMFIGPEKRILLPDGNVVLRTDIRQHPAPLHQKSNVRFREYIMLDSKEYMLACAKPEYSSEEDPEIHGWPACRTPKVDHAKVMIMNKTYQLTMLNSQNYVLRDESENTLLQIIHRGLGGGWDLETTGLFSPAVLCGLFFFCRYIEQENELLII